MKEKMKNIVFCLFLMVFIPLGVSAFTEEGWDVSFCNNTSSQLYVHEIALWSWWAEDFGSDIEVPSHNLPGIYYQTESTGADQGGIILLGVYKNPTYTPDNIYGLIIIDCEDLLNLSDCLNKIAIYMPPETWSSLTGKSSIPDIISWANNKLNDNQYDTIYITDKMSFWNPLEGNPLRVVVQFN